MAETRKCRATNLCAAIVATQSGMAYGRELVTPLADCDRLWTRTATSLRPWFMESHAQRTITIMHQRNTLPANGCRLEKIGPGATTVYFGSNPSRTLAQDGQRMTVEIGDGENKRELQDMNYSRATVSMLNRRLLDRDGRDTTIEPAICRFMPPGE